MSRLVTFLAFSPHFAQISATLFLLRSISWPLVASQRSKLASVLPSSLLKLWPGFVAILESKLLVDLGSILPCKKPSPLLFHLRNAFLRTVRRVVVVVVVVFVVVVVDDVVVVVVVVVVVNVVAMGGGTVCCFLDREKRDFFILNSSFIPNSLEMRETCFFLFFSSPLACQTFQTPGLETTP